MDPGMDRRAAVFSSSRKGKILLVLVKRSEEIKKGEFHFFSMLKTLEICSENSVLMLTFLPNFRPCMYIFQK